MMQFSLYGLQFLFSEIARLSHAPQTLNFRLDKVLTVWTGGHQAFQSIIMILDASMVATKGVKVVFETLNILCVGFDLIFVGII